MRIGVGLPTSTPPIGARHRGPELLALGDCGRGGPVRQPRGHRPARLRLHRPAGGPGRRGGGHDPAAPGDHGGDRPDPAGGACWPPRPPPSTPSPADGSPSGSRSAPGPTTTTPPGRPGGAGAGSCRTSWRPCGTSGRGPASAPGRPAPAARTCWSAAGAARAFLRAARHADGYVHGGGPPRAFASAAERARAAWADAGRPGRPAALGPVVLLPGRPRGRRRLPAPLLRLHRPVRRAGGGRPARLRRRRSGSRWPATPRRAATSSCSCRPRRTRRSSTGWPTPSPEVRVDGGRVMRVGICGGGPAGSVPGHPAAPGRPRGRRCGSATRPASPTAGASSSPTSRWPICATPTTRPTWRSTPRWCAGARSTSTTPGSGSAPPATASPPSPGRPCSGCWPTGPRRSGPTWPSPPRSPTAIRWHRSPAATWWWRPTACGRSLRAANADAFGTTLLPHRQQVRLVRRRLRPAGLHVHLHAHAARAVPGPRLSRTTPTAAPSSSRRSEAAWRSAGLDTMTETESLAFCQELFAPYLGGQPAPVRTSRCGGRS